MQSTKAKAFSLLAKRSYFSKQLREKLLEKGCPEKEVGELLVELQRQGWLNDQELADRFVRLQQQKGYGARVILHKLRQRAGPVSVQIEDGNLALLIEKKYKQKLPKERRKIIAALLRRGFSYDLINKTLEDMNENLEE